MKALDPLVSQHVADLEESATVVGPVVPSAAGAAGGGAKTVNITYPVKSALSMIVFVREMGGEASFHLGLVISAIYVGNFLKLKNRLMVFFTVL